MCVSSPRSPQAPEASPCRPSALTILPALPRCVRRHARAGPSRAGRVQAREAATRGRRATAAKPRRRRRPGRARARWDDGDAERASRFSWAQVSFYDPRANLDAPREHARHDPSDRGCLRWLESADSQRSLRPLSGDGGAPADGIPPGEGAAGAPGSLSIETPPSELPATACPACDYGVDHPRPHRTLRRLQDRPLVRMCAAFHWRIRRRVPAHDRARVRPS